MQTLNYNLQELILNYLNDSTKGKLLLTDILHVQLQTEIIHQLIEKIKIMENNYLISEKNIQFFKCEICRFVIDSDNTCYCFMCSLEFCQDCNLKFGIKDSDDTPCKKCPKKLICYNT